MACSLCEIIGITIFAVFLFSVSSRVQYYTKMIAFFLVAMISSAICIPLMLPRPRDYRNALIPAWCVVKIGEIIGVSFEVQGKENIKKEEGGIVLINHQSAIDLMGEFQ